ncbi:ABC-F family ATP-binding cassette domain-containing protein [Desulforamulus aeronauticus]|uniref:ATP-binding cassette, subfamily F, member 3 n=1 Tax=Desulforamulus aeronauticus DSM 10349 TaxID=1121421 RepID=A0A1M6VNE8_9FIRM|nr:ABC-F type ribosomal protection protein [Desulforamulus aeronauticus]SHK82851.1 ATP-binding cassette, subfamily F, member 3 [Desulforamulus aeronauticus DSM 10349]
MILLQSYNISKYFGAKQILNEVNVTIQDHEKIGLVGVNGAGKSTLLKILTGQLTPDAGELMRSGNLTLGYLAQDSGLESGRTIYEEMLSLFQPLIELEQQLRKLEELMGDSQVKSNETEFHRVLNQYDRLSETFREQGGYSYHSLIRGVLQGLDFPEVDDHSPISVLSGGQKTRLALAKNLLQKPDLLILDEPTNYLDIHSLAWLEQYLQTYSGAVLVVSHDRYFLDKVVTKIIELEFGRATTYPTNYSGFIDLKNQQQESLSKQFEQQQTEIAKAKDFIQRNMVRASTTKRAQSRLKALEKMELIEGPAAKQKQVFFTFDIKLKSGNDVLQVSDLAVGYSGVALAKKINFLIERGESVALLGPNGIGKSTLLKTIVGELPSLEGYLRKGTNVSIGYYAQQQEKLNPQKTVLDELWDDYRLMDERDVRTILGNFLFRGEDVYKKVGDLSGGEKARLSLAKLMLQKANLLILDEPTNHLDILSREILESSLVDYPGTILFVSHDRYFLNKMATRVIELSPAGTESFLGNYDYYQEKKAERNSQTTEKKELAKTQLGKQSYLESKEQQRLERKRLKRIEELEQLISATEEKITQITADLEKPEVAQNYTSCLELSSELSEKKFALDNYLEEWVSLTEE